MPYLGNAYCGKCWTEWMVFAPNGILDEMKSIECPNCGKMAGKLK